MNIARELLVDCGSTVPPSSGFIFSDFFSLMATFFALEIVLILPLIDSTKAFVLKRVTTGVSKII